MSETIKEKQDHKSSDILRGTDRVIEATMKVEPTREGRLEVRLAVVNRNLGIAGKLAHDLAIIGKADGHTGQFSECKSNVCAYFHHLAENTDQMLFQGV